MWSLTKYLTEWLLNTAYLSKSNEYEFHKEMTGNKYMQIITELFIVGIFL